MPGREGATEARGTQQAAAEPKGPTVAELRWLMNGYLENRARPDNSTTKMMHEALIAREKGR